MHTRERELRNCGKSLSVDQPTKVQSELQMRTSTPTVTASEHLLPIGGNNLYNKSHLNNLSALFSPLLSI